MHFRLENCGSFAACSKSGQARPGLRDLPLCINQTLAAKNITQRTLVKHLLASCAVPTNLPHFGHNLGERDLTLPAFVNEI
jgi:hypothetical protein